MSQLDLSNDNVATMTDSENISLAPKERAINMVIMKLFTKFCCKVRISNRLDALFGYKLYRRGRTLYSNEIIPYPNKKGEKDSIVTVSSKIKCEKLKKI